jgi:recombination protein RecA
MSLPSASDVAKALAGAIGANDEESTVTQFLDTGYPPLNYALSSKWDGGLPVGRIVEIAGPPSSGKTAIATAAMAAAQRAGGIAAFMDHERSFSLKLAPKLGLDVAPSKFIFKKPRTFEESLTMTVNVAKVIREKKLIAPEAPLCFTYDSLASMVPQSALFDKNGKEKALDDRSMHDNTALARATSAAFPAFAQHCEELNICALFLNQIRMKLGVMYGDPRTTPGGEAPKFYASLRVMLGVAKKIAKGEGEAAEVLGMLISAGVIKNKVARPFLKADWRFVFQPDGTGRFDVERSLIEFLESEGALKKGTSGRVEWEGKQIFKEHLARQIEKDGAFDKLKALLPAAYEPPVVASAELPAEEAA